MGKFIQKNNKSISSKKFWIQRITNWQQPKI